MNDFTVLVLRGAFPTAVATTLNLLGAARLLAPRLGAPVLRWTVVSADGGPVELQEGMCVQTAPLAPRGAADRSTWIVPGLGVDSPAALQARLAQDDARQVAAALHAHARAGGTVAAGCSSVFLLREAGLLTGRCVTTAWWLAPALQRLAPECHVDAGRMVCTDGRIVTAGAAFAQADLMAHLLRQRCGTALADAVTRALVIDARELQSPCRPPPAYASGDELIRRLAAHVEAALPDLPTVGALAREFCMSERTLARHVKRATGQSPIALLQGIRQRRARVLLETSRMTVEQVAAAVGYQDATALRRLMVRVSGASPRQFRPA